MHQDGLGDILGSRKSFGYWGNFLGDLVVVFLLITTTEFEAPCFVFFVTFAVLFVTLAVFRIAMLRVVLPVAGLVAIIVLFCHWVIVV